MTTPLMPKATAVWLVENTSLTFRQIADFCGLHELEVKGIADDEVAVGMVGLDPVGNGQLTKEEIQRCETDPKARLELRKPALELPSSRSKGPRYTPVARRQDKPDAISWLLKNTPELTDAQIAKLIGTTKNTINAVRDRSHWNSPNIKPQHPVALSLCGQRDLDETVERARKREEARMKREAKAAAKKKAAKAAKAALAAEDESPEQTKPESGTESVATADTGESDAEAVPETPVDDATENENATPGGERAGEPSVASTWPETANDS